MAKYFLRVKTFSRRQGSSATMAAAYRAGERIRDTRSGVVHDFTDRTDVVAAEIVLPRQHTGRVDMGWARDRSQLWNAAQTTGRLWNTRMAREVLVMLPEEMTHDQRLVLARTYSRDLADRYQCAVDFSVHLPREKSDPQNHHAHFLMTTRQVEARRPGPRTTLELSGTERHARGLGPSRGELLWMREHWATVTNEALRRAGLEVRIDHRSYAARGLNWEPKPFLPRKVFYKELSIGRPSEAGGRIRRQYRERMEARARGPRELARVVHRQRDENRTGAAQLALQRKASANKTNKPNGALTQAELREKRRAYTKEHAAEVKRKRQVYERAHADDIRRKKLARRAALGDEARRQDREYYRRAQEARGLTVRPRGPQRRPLEASSSKRPNVRTRAPLAPQATAGKSASEWLAFRQRQKKQEPTSSVEAWRAYRAGRGRQGTSTGLGQDSVREPVVGTETKPEKDSTRGHSKRRSTPDLSR